MDETMHWPLSILRTTHERWLQLASQAPTELLEWKPSPTEWSAVQCLQHIVDTEAVFRSRLQAFLEGRESFPAFNPDEEGSQGKSLPEAGSLAESFAETRTSSLEALATVKAEHLGRVARHQELGPVTLQQMINEWAAHDLNHTVQAERALMQPFIQGCGPWQIYFRDHWIGVE